jgi:acetyl esterase/lipase
MKRTIVFLATLACVIATTSHAVAQLLVDKNGFGPTRLVQKGSAPQAYEPIRESARLKQIEYRSGDLRLKGWLASPSKSNNLPVAIVYLHGGFSMSEQDMGDAQPFLDAGYSVLFPALRAENGNPGLFELMRGEVSDALAAADWISQSGGASRRKVVIFGHSIGGGTAELTTLQPSDSVLLSGSVGALYPAHIFQAWDFVPFDRADEQEIKSRTFLENVERMKRRHVAYVGDADFGARLFSSYRAFFEQTKAPVSVHLVPGDHHESVRPAILAFLEEIPKDVSK